MTTFWMIGFKKISKKRKFNFEDESLDKGEWIFGKTSCADYASIEREHPMPNFIAAAGATCPASVAVSKKSETKCSATSDNINSIDFRRGLFVKHNDSFVRKDRLDARMFKDLRKERSPCARTRISIELKSSLSFWHVWNNSGSRSAEIRKERNPHWLRLERMMINVNGAIISCINNRNFNIALLELARRWWRRAS